MVFSREDKQVCFEHEKEHLCGYVCSNVDMLNVSFSCSFKTNMSCFSVIIFVKVISLSIYLSIYLSVSEYAPPKSSGVCVIRFSFVLIV